MLGSSSVSTWTHCVGTQQTASSINVYAWILCIAAHDADYTLVVKCSVNITMLQCGNSVDNSRKCSVMCELRVYNYSCMTTHLTQQQQQQ